MEAGGVTEEPVVTHIFQNGRLRRMGLAWISQWVKEVVKPACSDDSLTFEPILERVL